MIINGKNFPSTIHYIAYLKKQNIYSEEEIIDKLVKDWGTKRMNALSILEYYLKEDK